MQTVWFSTRTWSYQKNKCRQVQTFGKVEKGKRSLVAWSPWCRQPQVSRLRVGVHPLFLDVPTFGPLGPSKRGESPKEWRSARILLRQAPANVPGPILGGIGPLLKQIGPQLLWPPSHLQRPPPNPPSFSCPGAALLPRIDGDGSAGAFFWGGEPDGGGGRGRTKRRTVYLALTKPTKEKNNKKRRYMKF